MLQTFVTSMVHIGMVGHSDFWQFTSPTGMNGRTKFQQRMSVLSSYLALYFIKNDFGSKNWTLFYRCKFLLSLLSGFWERHCAAVIYQTKCRSWFSERDWPGAETVMILCIVCFVTPARYDALLSLELILSIRSYHNAKHIIYVCNYYTSFLRIKRVPDLFTITSTVLEIFYTSLCHFIQNKWYLHLIN